MLALLIGEGVEVGESAVDFGEGEAHGIWILDCGLRISGRTQSEQSKQRAAEKTKAVTQIGQMADG
jgi:hypothetical protein